MATVTHYAPTYIGRDGLRTLMRGACARDVFPTEAAALKWMTAVLENTHADTLRSIYGNHGSFEVRPVQCWLMHDGSVGDPIGIYFD